MSVLLKTFSNFDERYSWTSSLTCSASLSATTQDNLDDKLRKFEIRDMMGLTDDRDISETVSETWSTDVLGSDFDPNMDEDRLQEIAGVLWFCCVLSCSGWHIFWDEILDIVTPD